MINECVHNIEELVIDLDYAQIGVIDGNHCVLVDNIRMIVDRKEYDRVSKLLRVDVPDEEEEAILEEKDVTDSNVDGLEV